MVDKTEKKYSLPISGMKEKLITTDFWDINK